MTIQDREEIKVESYHLLLLFFSLFLNILFSQNAFISEVPHKFQSSKQMNELLNDRIGFPNVFLCLKVLLLCQEAPCLVLLPQLGRTQRHTAVRHLRRHQEKKSSDFKGSEN